MAISGNLAEFSLSEIFQLLEQGHKTALITIQTSPPALSQTVEIYHIWVHQDCIVAFADRSDGKGLISTIARRWLSERVVLRVAQLCPLDAPLGICLQTEGILQAEDLKLLFHNQVVEKVSCLFELGDGQFEIDTKATLPLKEMIGLHLPLTEATLMGLRRLQDWTGLAEKLPDPTSTLSRDAARPQLMLDYLEWQVWQLADGSISLGRIAGQLRLPVEKVQQIAFLLMAVNLVEEVLMIATPTVPAIASSHVAPKLHERQIGAASKPYIRPMSTPQAIVNHQVVEKRPEPQVNTARKPNSPPPLTPAAANSRAEKRSNPEVNTARKSQVSQSFIQNLFSFLRDAF